MHFSHLSGIVGKRRKRIGSEEIRVTVVAIVPNETTTPPMKLNSQEV
jgi:hypothetical protein